MTIESPDRGLVSAPSHNETQPRPGPVLPRTWTIEVAFAGEWLTANKPSRYRFSATDWRNAAMVACMRARLPKGITPVRLHAVVWYDTARPPVRDRLNLMPTIKAIVDGLTPTVISTRNGKPHSRGGYGLIPDDSDKHVLETTWALVAGMRPRVDLHITHVPAEPALSVGVGGTANEQR